MATQIYLIAPLDAEAAPFGALLDSLLEVTEISALLLRRGERSGAEFETFAKAIIPRAQQAGCAVLVDGDARLAKALGADGLHVDGDLGALKSAIGSLRPAMIVGASGVTSRHEAMSAGELDPDYIMFGPFSGVTAPEQRDLAEWWAETMEIPSVISDPAAGAETPVTVCEFLALSDSIFSAADPVAALQAVLASQEQPA